MPYMFNASLVMALYLDTASALFALTWMVMKIDFYPLYVK